MAASINIRTLMIHPIYSDHR